MVSRLRKWWSRWAIRWATKARARPSAGCCCATTCAAACPRIWPRSISRRLTTLSDVSEVLDRLYNQPLAQPLFGRFRPVRAGEHYHEPYCQAVVAQAFEAFFEQIVAHYS